MDFDIFTEREAVGAKTEYGILLGGEATVFIKAGRGGTYRGEGDKYLRFAAFLREKYGASVICSGNHEACKSSLEADISVLREYARGGLYLWGTSDGAFKCTEIACALPFEKMVLVNMPLMINFHKTKARLAALDASRIAFVYGEADPSFKYVPFLRSLEGAKSITLEKTGHVTACKPEECALFARLLFE